MNQFSIPDKLIDAESSNMTAVSVKFVSVLVYVSKVWSHHVNYDNV